MGIQSTCHVVSSSLANLVRVTVTTDILYATVIVSSWLMARQHKSRLFSAIIS